MKKQFISIAMAAAVMIMPAALPQACECQVMQPDPVKLKAVFIKPEWRKAEARITDYCPECNSPSGHQSSSGKYLEDGDCACSWLPIGTEVRINGNVYTVADRCGTDAIDIFRDTETCQCDDNYYTTVYIKEVN